MAANLLRQKCDVKENDRKANNVGYDLLVLQDLVFWMFDII